MKKILYIILSYLLASSALANQPKDWQLGFQEPASSAMRDIVNFHDNLLLTNHYCNQCFCFIFDGLCMYSI
jgi:cytochrome c oxidase subunit 2